MILGDSALRFMGRSRAVLVWVACCLPAASVAAQEMTPRAYWPAPLGTKVAILGYSYSSGDVLMDPSLPIYDVDSKINTGILGYLQTFSLWGRTSNLIVDLPYSWGTTNGIVDVDPAHRDFSGFNDLGVTLSVNLLGAPSMSREGFRELRAKPRPILGASLKVQAPTGHYDPDKLINTSTNRWAIKAELGSIIPLHPRWLLEIEAGAWFFGNDDEYLQGQREQAPILAIELHLVRRFKPGFWASLEANYFRGGRQTIGGDQHADLQRNSRIGGTLVVPFRGRHAVKVGYSTSLRTDFGTDFDQFLVSYQTLF